jgi:hypothetical protein
MMGIFLRENWAMRRASDDGEVVSWETRGMMIMVTVSCGQK